MPRASIGADEVSDKQQRGFAGSDTGGTIESRLTYVFNRPNRFLLAWSLNLDPISNANPTRLTNVAEVRHFPLFEGVIENADIIDDAVEAIATRTGPAAEVYRLRIGSNRGRRLK